MQLLRLNLTNVTKLTPDGSGVHRAGLIPTLNWGVFVLGIAALTVSVALIVLRNRIAAHNKKSVERVFGDRPGFTGLVTPVGPVLTGVVFFVLGTLAIIQSI